MKLKRITRSWIIDTLLLMIIVLGIYAALNLEQFGPQWMESIQFVFAQELESVITNVTRWMQNTVAGISIQILFGLGLAVFVTALIGWRIIWRLRESKRFTGTECPECGYPLSRIRRTPLQRKISKFIPIRRFYCKKCKWKGLRLKSNNPVPLDVQQSTSKPTAPDKIDLG